MSTNGLPYDIMNASTRVRTHPMIYMIEEKEDRGLTYIEVIVPGGSYCGTAAKSRLAKGDLSPETSSLDRLGTSVFRYYPKTAQVQNLSNRITRVMQEAGFLLISRS